MAKEYRRLAKLIADFHFKEEMDASAMHDTILRWKAAKEHKEKFGSTPLHYFFGDCLNMHFWRRRRNAPEVPFNKRRPLIQMRMAWRDEDVKMENPITMGRVEADDLTYYAVFDKQESRDNDRFFTEYSVALSYYYYRVDGKQRAHAYLDNRQREYRSVEELRHAVVSRSVLTSARTEETTCTGNYLRLALQQGALSIAGSTLLLTRIQQDREFGNHFILCDGVELYEGKDWNPKLQGQVGYLYHTAIHMNGNNDPMTRDIIEVIYPPKS